MAELHKSRPLLWILFGLLSLAWLLMLGYRTLVPPDEADFAEIARAMWLSRDWAKMQLHGSHQPGYPALQTWISVLSFDLFGTGQWQARLWTGLCGLGTVFLTGYTGLKVFGPRAGL
jgi:4-amino-4-deoxy-L-arabinose transferase-like glycosyltransferase